MTIQFKMPDVILPGDSIHWRIADPSHLTSEGWAAVILLRNSESEIDLSSSPDENDDAVHVIKTTPSDTNKFDSGNYSYRVQFHKGEDEVITVQQGQVRVAASFDGAVDARSDAQIAYDNVLLLFSGKATSDVYEYEIRGRRLKYYEMDELVTLKRELKKEVDIENAAKGIAPVGKFTGQIRVRFGQ